MLISRSKLPHISLAVCTLLICSALQSFALPKRASSLINYSNKEVIDQVWQIIYRYYLDSENSYNPETWIQLRRTLLAKQYIDKTDSYDAIRSMLSDLNDPYTRFLDPKEFKEMRIDTSGELMGVGIQLSLDEETKELIVVSPIEGTPAFKGGVQPKDVIVSIDERNTKGMSIENAVKLIRGKKGTAVILGLRRNNKVINVNLVRERIEIKAVESHLNKTNKGVNVGYIRLKQFNANSPKEMRNAINTLEKKKAQGYVLDLRSNPGGLLDASVEIGRQWLNEGIIVSTQTRDGIKDVRRANGKALTSQPLIVLVNEGSASASEILSGAIQDNKRGFLVGQKTFGKGLVQSVRGLSDGSGMTVTIAKYLTPLGTDIHKNGINPDEISEFNSINLTKFDLGTFKDNQYKTAENILVKLILKNQNNTNYDYRSKNLKEAIINN